MDQPSLNSLLDNKGLYSTQERQKTLKALFDYPKPLTAKQHVPDRGFRALRQ